MPRWFNRLFGSAGERAAVRYLKRRGYRIVARNYENHTGEIDVIALEGETIVFVEVKTRRSSRKGHPLEAVDVSKQRQILKTAQVYLKERDLLDRAVRYDIVGIMWPETQPEPEIQHLISAFPD
ncbi:MAG: YraN family protein [Planctomycetaceae bacterium]|nr:YraN family protein [Planctomycetaceae bacterium]